MGLENLNSITVLPSVQQSGEGGGTGITGAPQDPLLFLQQLLSQIQSISGDVSKELSAIPQDGQGGLEALKAALANLSAVQQQPEADGKNLPQDAANAGMSLPPELAAMLAGVQGVNGTPEAAANLDKAMVADEDLLSLQQVDSQATQAQVQAPVLVQVQDVSPSLAQAMPLAKAAAEAAPHTDIDSLVSRSPINLSRANVSETLVKGFTAAAAAPAAGTVSNAVEAAFVTPKDEGFANSLASVAAGIGNASLSQPMENRIVSSTVPMPVATPVGQPGWDQEFNDRIVWMAGKGIDSASLHLNPPNLGPVEVRISLSQDQQQANIQFVSGHAAVREAIESAVPRLREMMGGQQLNLVSVDISNQSPQQQSANRDDGRPQHQQHSASRSEDQVLEGEELAVPQDVQRVIRTSNGLLNLYA